MPLWAGIFGNILSFMFSPNAGVGASGAIFGLLGALLYFGLERPSLFKASFGANVIVMIVINLFYGFTKTGIDNFAHIGTDGKVKPEAPMTVPNLKDQRGLLRQIISDRVRNKGVP